MNATTKIRFTRRTNALGELEYRYETDTHRYITSRRNAWWVTDIYSLTRVGTSDPALMVRDRRVGDLLHITLRDAREEIAQDAERRTRETAARTSVPQHANAPETVETGWTENPETVQEIPAYTRGYVRSDANNAIVQDAVNALQGLPLAVFATTFPYSTAGTGVRVVQDVRMGPARISWMVDGLNGTAYGPVIDRLEDVVRTMRTAGWSARIEGYDVITWRSATDDE